MKVAKQLFSEGTHKIKVIMEKIITHQDGTLMMLLTGKRMIQLQESISESLKQQGVECGTCQRHCRLTPSTSKIHLYSKLTLHCYTLLTSNVVQTSFWI